MIAVYSIALHSSWVLHFASYPWKILSIQVSSTSILCIYTYVFLHEVMIFLSEDAEVFPTGYTTNLVHIPQPLLCNTADPTLCSLLHARATQGHGGMTANVFYTEVLLRPEKDTHKALWTLLAMETLCLSGQKMTWGLPGNLVPPPSELYVVDRP